MADWISPDSHEEGDWTSEALSYDGNTATYAYKAAAVFANTSLITLIAPGGGVYGQYVRFYAAGSSTSIAYYSLDSYYDGDWNVEAINTVFNHDEWTTFYNIIPRTREKVRIKFLNDGGSPATAYLKEIEIYGNQITTTSTSSTTSSSTSTSTSSSTTTSTSTSTTTLASTSTSTTSTSTSSTTSTSSSTSTTTSTSSSTSTTSTSTSSTTSTSSSTSTSTTLVYQVDDILWAWAGTTTSTSSSTSTSTSTSSSTTTTLSPSSGGLVYGEENPTGGETPVSWATWSDGAGGSPTVIGDADWGKVQLAVGASGHSGVYDFGTATSRLITVTEDKYGAGQGSATVQIRGQAAIFGQDDGAPSWENYSGIMFRDWRYIQVRATK